MSIESAPEFTPQAATLWDRITVVHQKQLLAKVWCSHCSHSVKIKNFKGTVVSGDLLLTGQCAHCNGKVARLIESA